MTTIAWFSGGATSAIACLKAIEQDPTTRLVYIETGSHHPDCLRFLADCEYWYGKPIETIKDSRYINHLDVCRKTRFINSPFGAACTRLLKISVRKAFIESLGPDVVQVWGFDAEEPQRAEKFRSRNPGRHLFPLLDANLTKADCIALINKAGIALPAMYLLGYHNANCIGCVKGGKGYWNKIRVDFPDVFLEMSLIEREIGRSCLRGVFLDELDPESGRHEGPLVPACGATGEGCEVQQLREYSKE
jgi:3'-phosphoadenosine 5'-phosphosulfate sulfotransferase (PAPS reductase)/FAD synthetase